MKEAGRKFTAQAPTAHISMALSLDSTYNGTSAQSSAVWNLIGRRLLEEDALPLPKRVRADATLTYDNVLTGIRTWLKADSSRRMLIMLDEADGFFESDSPRFTETRRLRDLSSETNDGVKIVFAGLHSVQRYATLAANNPFSHLSQHPTVIGPLQPQDAANLLLKPLAALGYQFLEPQLVHRILGHCSYQPFLLQMFAHRLVQTMHAKRREAKSGPLHFIARDDIERVQSDKDLQRSITAAFHDTLRLDSRYNMIANVVAHHAHHHGIDARMTHAELRDECTYWWAEGFRDLDPDQFRAYLTEMEGLGVLAPDPDHRGWHLRSANALSMIGTLEDVDAQLENTSSRQVTERLTALETRHKS
ncbi:nSTAND1 domain-containing NTPase, partial [Streptomyces griseoincarnatus]